MIRQDGSTEGRAFRKSGVIIACVILAVGVGVLLAASCGEQDRFAEPPGDTVSLGLQCDGDYPAERAAYYVGPELTWYEAAQICLDCPNWPFRADADECAQRALAKFR
jgi:hypothetical protein